MLREPTTPTPRIIPLVNPVVSEIVVILRETEPEFQANLLTQLRRLAPLVRRETATILPSQSEVPYQFRRTPSV